jgi:hypothetical protein
VFFFATYGSSRRHLVGLDGSNEMEVPAPGGNTVSHAGIRADGSEFVNPDNLTSYLMSTGTTGTIDDLRHTTSMMSQLAELGLAEVPANVVGGQGGNGTFALSVDWSRNGRMLVFDALVSDKATGDLGVAIFTWDLHDQKLRLVYGPEPLSPDRTRNFNYSIHTPKWIP